MKTATPSPKRRAGGQAASNGHAVQTVTQILFSTGRAYTLETLRKKLRESFVEENDFEKRAVALMTTVQLITALLEATPQLEALGLQIRLTNGTAQLFTARIQNEKLSAFIAEKLPETRGAGELTQRLWRFCPVLPSDSPLPKRRSIGSLGMWTSGMLWRL